MMTNRPVSDEFETMLNNAFDDVSGAVQPPAGLAERLVADVRAGRRPVTDIGTARRAKRWTLPLLAAASIVAVAVALVVAANHGGQGHHVPPIQTKPVPSPTPAPPKPPALPHFRAVDVQFSDAVHGWALGDARCPSSTRTNCAALLGTSDGGGSWHELGLPAGLVSTFDSASCGTNGTLHGPCVDDVLFANPSDGYLWSLHEIYWTTDGGHHWRRYVDPAHDWDGASRIVVAGDAVVRLAPIAQCSAGCWGEVETAPLGTTDWQVTTPPKVHPGLYSSGLGVSGADIYLFAGGTAEAYGRGIYRSSDGGRNWQHVAANACGKASSPDQDHFWGAGGIVADDGALIVHCLGVPPGSISIRVASPGSTSFSDPRRMPGEPVVEAAQTEQRIVVADTTHAYAGKRSKTTVYTSTDGGRSWQKSVTLPVGGAGVRFTSGASGYAIASNGADYYATSDGGTSWQDRAFSA